MKCSHEPGEAVKYLERNIILNAVDRLWQEHLYATDALREAVYLRAYGQKDPLVEYKTEAYDMFTELMANIKSEIVSNLFRSTANLEAFGQFLQNLPQFLISSDETGAQQTQGPAGERPGEPRRTHRPRRSVDPGSSSIPPVEEIGIGMLGYAFMGKAHANAYRTLSYMTWPPLPIK